MPNLGHKDFLLFPPPLSRTFIALGFPFRSVIDFEIIFVCGVAYGSTLLGGLFRGLNEGSSLQSAFVSASASLGPP